MSINTVIFTASSLRHKAFAEKAKLSENLNLLNIFYEKGSVLKNIVETRDNNLLERSHLKARAQAEKDVFDWFLSKPLIYKNLKEKYVDREWFSSQKCLSQIEEINPDLILVYGTSIIKGPLVKRFQGKILNIHLGLSPYYRGSGTNYFPFVNGEPEYCGATYMFLDEGIDTGAIIHQIRPDINEVDSFHQLSNRFLLKAFNVYLELAENFPKLTSNQNKFSTSENFKFYKKKDFNANSVKILYENFQGGMIKNYLKNKYERDRKVPIIRNSEISF